MASRQKVSKCGTLTTGPGSPGRAREGVVTGHLFKVTRERAGLTQQALAEAIAVDVTTVQGWESGRRALTAIPSAQFRQMRRHLLRSGADPALLVLFDAAMDADAVLSHGLSDRRSGDAHGHPLANWVFTRSATHMIAWALTGTPPAALPRPPAGMPRRRGPTPDGPLLGEPERRAFFDGLRRSAEVADWTGAECGLLRRQALYLCSYDVAPDTHAWMTEMRGRQARASQRSAWNWADARSLATSLTRHGERDALHAFIERGMSDDAGELANLNYWAYWLGLDNLPRSDDAFMAGRAEWDAKALLRSLVGRMSPELGCIDLNVHSVWSLLAARPGALAADHELSCDLKRRVTRLLDGGVVSTRSRRELDAVHYGLKLNAP
ncbi:helix-turn-helix transcriptional regulator [Streptomyces sp. AC536]|uniref:helix-turn-helix domain-containing protein n=1 Tax=Streptomyces buecherae TaxID=2763006 RepID=UPI00164E22F1|nr:helix-turn-helix domain-containing protein [Streptomyces buecherae]MBC3983493.1 helix-turn-helix transcriptional regulator [Streptomyces buecherae]QNJ40909.1 helix-turn-helix transcriptional regulator [Streptomyces buecherae]